MKGIVFVKFNEFFEELWEDEFWDELLDEAELPSEDIVHGLAQHTVQEIKVCQFESEYEGGQRCVIEVEKV
jgi:hypothetical protein